MNTHPNKQTRRGWEAVAALAKLDGGIDTIPEELGHRAREKIHEAGELRAVIRSDGALVHLEFGGIPLLKPVGRVPLNHPLIEFLMITSGFLVGDLAVSASVLREKLEAIGSIADMKMEENH